MEGIVNVSTEQLKSTASEFSSIGGTIRNLTQSMTETITSLSGSWEGEASQSYLAKFNSLQDDIERMHSMINEHVNDLNDMADRYAQAESQSVSDAQALSSDVIS